MFCLEAFRKDLYQFYDNGHFFTSVELLLRVQAVVACSAILLCELFSEVVEQKLSATGV